MTIFAGHYGSGKTQICVNFALKSAKEKKTVVDLDIVNPYFRTTDCREVLENAGIKLISSVFAGSNLESPGLPPDAAVIFDQPEVEAFIDVGGDERGALVLGRFATRITNYNMYLVVNTYRPLSQNADDLLEIKDEIEKASRLQFSGIIANPNLGKETTGQVVIDAIPTSEEISKKLNLPIIYTTVREDIKLPNTYPITIYDKPEWKIDLP